MIIREAESHDANGIWEIFEDVIKAGDTYAFLPDTRKDELQKLWFAPV